MSGIKAYLLCVISAAILCALISQLAGKDGFLGASIKLLTGVFMLLAMISPVSNLQIQAPSNFLSDITAQADAITATAADSTQESVASIIKEQTQAYILDKANIYGVKLTVDVRLSDDDLHMPVGVTLCGNISPYTKKILSQTIEKDLGIAAEAQIWN